MGDRRSASQVKVLVCTSPPFWGILARLQLAVSQQRTLGLPQAQFSEVLPGVMSDTVPLAVYTSTKAQWPKCSVLLVQVLPEKAT